MLMYLLPAYETEQAAVPVHILWAPPHSPSPSSSSNVPHLTEFWVDYFLKTDIFILFYFFKKKKKIEALKGQVNCPGSGSENNCDAGTQISAF